MTLFRPQRRQQAPDWSSGGVTDGVEGGTLRWRSLQVRVMALVSLGVLAGASAAVAADARQVAVEHRAAVGRELTGVARTFGYGLGHMEQASPTRLQAHLVALHHGTGRADCLTARLKCNTD